MKSFAEIFLNDYYIKFILSYYRFKLNFGYFIYNNSNLFKLSIEGSYKLFFLISSSPNYLKIIYCFFYFIFYFYVYIKGNSSK